MTGHFALAQVSSAGPVVLLLLLSLLHVFSSSVAVVSPVCTHVAVITAAIAAVITAAAAAAAAIIVFQLYISSVFSCAQTKLHKPAIAEVRQAKAAFRLASITRVKDVHLKKKRVSGSSFHTTI